MVDVSEKMIEAGLKSFYLYDPSEDRPEQIIHSVYTAMHSAREVDEGVVESIELVRKQLTVFDRGINSITFTAGSGFAIALKTIVRERRNGAL